MTHPKILVAVVLSASMGASLVAAQTIEKAKRYRARVSEHTAETPSPSQPVSLEEPDPTTRELGSSAQIDELGGFLGDSREQGIDGADE